MKNIEHFFVSSLHATALAVVVLFVAACSSKKSKPVAAPVSVTVVEARAADASDGREYVGTVVEHEGTALSFEVPGCLLTLRADAGDRVQKGQLLATIDPAQLRDAHAAALSTLRQAQDAYRRFKPLHEQGVLSDMKWVEVQTRLEQAQSAEAIARTQLQRTSLTAPFSGVVSQRTAERGMNVLAGQQIFKLSDISKIDVKISVPEAELSSIHVGDKASVSVSALSGATFGATVGEKGIEADAVSHTYLVKLSVDGVNRRLMPGMVCNVRLATAAKKGSASALSQGMEVPLCAVKLDTDNRRFVWVAEHGKARQQYVSIGDFTERGVIVTSGLREGDLVIAEGSQKVSEGMQLKINR